MNAAFGEEIPRKSRVREPDDPAIRDSAALLGHISMRLRLLGTTALVLSLANIAILLWWISRAGHSGSGAEGSLALINLVVTVITISVVGYFESMRKRGDAIFQELSDELQWHVGRGGSRSVFEDERPGDSPRERPLLEVRLAMRSFSAAAELPLFPGAMGGAFYAVFNLLIAIASAVLLAR